MKLILASNSKTRKDIFDMIGWKYEVITSNVVENSNSIDPKQYVIDLSKDKANSVASQIKDKALIISADSIIYMDNKKFEKPKTKEEGFENIKKMSGKVNYAITGVTIKDLYKNKEITFTDVTEVYFKNVSDKEKMVGRYELGRYAWHLSDIRVIEPVQAKGKLGIWNYDFCFAF